MAKFKSSTAAIALAGSVMALVASAPAAMATPFYLEVDYSASTGIDTTVSDLLAQPETEVHAILGLNKTASTTSFTNLSAEGVSSSDVFTAYNIFSLTGTRSTVDNTDPSNKAIIATENINLVTPSTTVSGLQTEVNNAWNSKLAHPTGAYSYMTSDTLYSYMNIDNTVWIDSLGTVVFDNKGFGFTDGTNAWSFFFDTKSGSIASNNFADYTVPPANTIAIAEITGLAVVPAPSPLAVLGSGLLALGLIHRRRKAA